MIKKPVSFSYISFISILLLLSFMLFTTAQAHAEAKDKLFFLMGDGKIHIRNAKTGKEAKVSLLNSDSQLISASFERIDEVFNFPTKQKGENISPRLIFMLDYFSDLVSHGKVIILESGYRSHDYNSNIRNKGANAAKTSTHIDGLALDFHIDGVNGKKLWEVIKQYQCCGVGHYGGNTVHLDAARPRFWEASTSKVHTGESDYNRRIYLSTDYDRYKSGETVRLSLSSVSDFGFGIKKDIAIIDTAAASTIAANASIKNHGDKDCVMINDRKSSRFIYFTVPEGVKAGRYKVMVDFCEKPFEQMPRKVFSNEIEIILN